MSEITISFEDSILNNCKFDHQGVSFLKVDKIHAIEPHQEFIPRKQADQYPNTKKHLISYNFLWTEDESHDIYLFLYRRASKVSEQRLKGMVSLGIGGHINPLEEGDLNLAIHVSTQRELEEEIILTPENNTEIFEYITQAKPEEFDHYYIRDDSNEVGTLHLGIGFPVFIPFEYRPHCAETELETIGWVKLEDVAQYVDQMENWSKMLYEFINGFRTSLFPNDEFVI